MIKVEIHGAYAACVQPQLLTTGMVGAVVEFSFDEVWDGLTKCAVFTDGVVAKDVLLHGNTCVIPHEVLTTDGRLLSVGVYGANAADDVVVPTVYTSIGMVSFGADPSGDESYPPTPDVAAQIFGRIEKLESGNGGEDTGTAIIDVPELPTENINEDVLYRLTTGMVVFNGQNGRVFDNTAVYIVDSLPETGEPCSSDIGESTAIYYNTSKGAAYGYVDERASVSLMQPVGWKGASTAFAAMGYQYSGVVTSMNDVARSSAAVLLEHALYHYKNGWKRVAGDTPFFDLSNLGLEAVDLAGVADGVSVRVGADTRAIINALARGAVKFGFQIIYNGATLDVEALGSAMYLEAENTYQIHNFSVFADMPMTVTISVDELYVSVSVAAAQSGGTSTTLPNPHKLTFSGAVSAEYDGSEPVEVVIPEGGGGGIPLPPTAEVGQFFKVSAVENGKVTAVEAVNMASGGEGEASEFELVVDVTTEEVVQTLEFPFTNQNVKEIFVFVKPAASFAPNNAFFSIEGESQIVFRFAHINSLTIGKTGMFVNAKFAGEMVFSTLCLKADYMWNSDKQYASEYERQNEAEDITKIVLDFYADVPVGTVIRVYAR